MRGRFLYYEHTNWKVGLGGNGPIDSRGGKLAFASLKTSAQVERSKRLADSYENRVRRPIKYI